MNAQLDANILSSFDWNAIVTKALEKDRERRYPSVAEFAADVTSKRSLTKTASDPE